MNKQFMDENFLLDNAAAQYLYHDYAKDLPIIDYHNHLSPQDIAEDKVFSSITELWLKEDHYKWRAMRTNGIHEKYITGKTNDIDKFLMWAKTVPHTIRNPLFHWTHLELKRYFNINDILNESNAEDIFNFCNHHLEKPEYAAKGLLNQMNVELVCTTDDPTDTLEYHKAEESALSTTKMLPTFRPDRFINLNSKNFLNAIEELEDVVKYDISSFDILLSALNDRIDFFASLGCKLADHGLTQLYKVSFTGKDLNAMFLNRRRKELIDESNAQVFQMAMLHELSKIYFDNKWTMQFHLGAIRNNNSKLQKNLGNDAGADSIGDYNQAEGLADFLDRLDADNKLTKTILYNLNPRDNEVFATMIGNFNDGSTPGKIQWGSAWWFLDQKDGMEKQINTLSNLGLLSRFIGMLTDSRSFLSFPRHEYFRRILCNLIGRDVTNGELPNDLDWLGSIVENICYNNAKQYFNF